MVELEAVRAAIDLLHVPARARGIRRDPLPRGVGVLLRVGAGDDAVAEECARLTERPANVIRDAALFFIDEILLHRDADSYRVLGLEPGAQPHELRHNMALLLKRLHPDVDFVERRSALAQRVAGAWNDLKTDERRNAYDERRKSASVQATRDAKALERLSKKSSKRGLLGAARKARRRVARWTWRTVADAGGASASSSAEDGALRRLLETFLRETDR